MGNDACLNRPIAKNVSGANAPTSMLELDETARPVQEVQIDSIEGRRRLVRRYPVTMLWTENKSAETSGQPSPVLELEPTVSLEACVKQWTELIAVEVSRSATNWRIRAKVALHGFIFNKPRRCD